MVFIDLRDRAGIVQLAVGPGAPEGVRRTAAALASETVVEVEGEVGARPPNMKNPELATGEVEVHPGRLVVVGPAVTPAIPVTRAKGEELPAEELRLKYRHLDLRRPEMQANLVLRHRLLQRARKTLSDLDFLEIETPILTKPTPEGARDYLVPSRVHPGEFYALPQSPQLYKQLLMVSGFDRYFQLARCFRDEDLRNDRQPEFTQIDLEASFVGIEDVLGYVEAVLVALWDEAGHKIARPFPRITWREAMERYGTDKPDLRYELSIADWTAQVKPLAVPFVESTLKDGARVRGLAVKGGGGLSRKDVDQLAEAAKQLGGSGLAWVKRQGEHISGSVGKHFTAETLGQLGVGDGDAALMAVGPDRVTSPVLDRVRQEVIRRLEFQPKAAHAFCWVVDFPLFEPDPETGKPVFAHHPFTSPHPDDRACPVRGRARAGRPGRPGGASHRDQAMSDEITHRLSTEGVDPLALAGVNDGNLVALAQRLGVRVSLRGDTLMLHGPLPAVERAVPVAQALVDLVRMGGGEPLDVADVLRGRGQGAPGPRAHPADGEGKINLPGLRRVIQAKTAGQREY